MECYKLHKMHQVLTRRIIENVLLIFYNAGQYEIVNRASEPKTLKMAGVLDDCIVKFTTNVIDL